MFMPYDIGQNGLFIRTRVSTAKDLSNFAEKKWNNPSWRHKVSEAGAKLNNDDGIEI